MINALHLIWIVPLTAGVSMFITALAAINKRK